MRRLLALALTTAFFPALALPGASASDPTGVSPSCAPVFDKPVPASRAVRQKGLARATAALEVSRATRGRETLATLAEDPAYWLDTCGRPYAVDRAASTAPKAPPVASFPLSSTFELSSSPGASKTLYLDFTGDVLRNTAWNDSEANGEDLTFGPFSRDSDPTFSSEDLAAIQQAFLLVSEDYAAFDVNVTTEEPPPSALYKDSSSDQVFGVRVLISSSSAMGRECSCGGLGYMGITQESGDTLAYYSPALVFAENLYNDGRYVGEAAAHEIGHNLGLAHDGSLTSSYHSGSKLQAPIMGTAYYSSLSQWSKGDYPGADNKQDDLAIIGASFPRRPDDHGVGLASTTLKPGSPAVGTFTSSGDKDGFTFSASGPTRVQAGSYSLYGNTDIVADLYDSSGRLIHTSNPQAAHVAPDGASGLNIDFTLDLAPDTYSLVLAPTGATTPDGAYPAYGSIGKYVVSLSSSATSSEPELEPVVQGDKNHTVRSGAPFSIQLLAQGGDGTYSWTAQGPTPPGLTLSPSGLLSGTVSEAGEYSLLIEAASGPASRAVRSSDYHILTVVGEVEPTTEALTFKRKAWLPRATYKRKYRTAIPVAGGSESYTWNVRESLPPGLRVNRRAARLIVTGWPKRRGLYGLAVRVTDGSDQIRRTFKLRVR